MVCRIFFALQLNILQAPYLSSLNKYGTEYRIKTNTPPMAEPILSI